MPAQIVKTKQSAPAKKQREPLFEPLRIVMERVVKLVVLFNSIDVQKNYGDFTMVFDGRRFRKLVPGINETQTPTLKEAFRFANDIAEAAKDDEAIAGFIEKHPLPRRLQVVK